MPLFCLRPQQHPLPYLDFGNILLTGQLASCSPLRGSPATLPVASRPDGPTPALHIPLRCMGSKYLDLQVRKEMTTHSSILAWEAPHTEEPPGYSLWGCKEWDATEHLSTSRPRESIVQGHMATQLSASLPHAGPHPHRPAA